MSGQKTRTRLDKMTHALLLATLWKQPAISLKPHPGIVNVRTSPQRCIMHLLSGCVKQKQIISTLHVVLTLSSLTSSASNYNKAHNWSWINSEAVFEGLLKRGCDLHLFHWPHTDDDVWWPQTASASLFRQAWGKKGQPQRGNWETRKHFQTFPSKNVCWCRLLNWTCREHLLDYRNMQSPELQRNLTLGSQVSWTVIYLNLTGKIHCSKSL